LVKDKTHYRFNGEVLGKGRLVLAVVEHHMNKNALAYEELLARFAPTPMVSAIFLDEIAYREQQHTTTDNLNRYFIDTPLQDSKGKTFYVKNQWGKGNIDGFITLSRALGEHIDIIPDEDSEVIKLYRYHKEHSPADRVVDYAAQCRELATLDFAASDFDEAIFLERYWRSQRNGIASVGPGMFSHDDFKFLRNELVAISKKIMQDPTAETLDSIIQWAQEAKAKGHIKLVRRGVIRRFFCACRPESLSTLLNDKHLKAFVRSWNSSGYGQKIESSDNWLTLNARILHAVKMRGLEGEDPFLVNTFTYRFGEFLAGDNPAAFGEPTIAEPKAVVKLASQPSAPLNQILYGPSGTGKTYATVEAALNIIDPGFSEDIAAEGLSERASRAKLKQRFDELLKTGQIAFTTFHQSVSYEDFVEGLRAEAIDDRIAYSVEPGIFKRICQQANPNATVGRLEKAIDELKETCSEEPLSLSTATGKVFLLSYRGGKTFSCMPEASVSDRDLPANIDHVRKMVLGERPEKLYCGSYVKAIAAYLRDTYGIEPGERRTPVIAAPHVLIIDEINRGNTAQIFGELITLLEPDKRAGETEGLSAILPYSKESLSVPANLYVIGTMNTADTSLAKIDIALRRRFTFIEVMPDIALLQDIIVAGVDIGLLLKAMNQRIELLYDRDHCIGHSYFMGLSVESSIEDLAVIFESHLIPLLEEYFYDDWALIHQVLGDHLKGKHQPKFIVEKYTTTEMQQLLGANWQVHIGEPTRRWTLNLDALHEPAAYQGVYAPVEHPVAFDDSPFDEKSG